VRSQRSRLAETGICGTICSPSARIWLTVAALGVLPSSAKETCIPRLESSPAIAVMSATGARTMIPAACRLVWTRVSGSALRIMLASALTSSVDMIHVPTPKSISNCTESVTIATLQTGRGNTRRGGSSTMSTAAR
jgi:hypothetical protein